MQILIKPLNDIARDFYENHSHFHKGDSGLDLFIAYHIGLSYSPD